MRIIMLTDDQQIDRRILQEAETLIANSHEVILIAPLYQNTKPHEKIGNVKIVRISMENNASLIERAILRTQTFLINLCNKFSISSQKVVEKMATKNQNGINNTITKINSMYGRYINFVNNTHARLNQRHYRVWNFIGLTLSKAVTIASIFFNKIFCLLIQGSQFLLLQINKVFTFVANLLEKVVHKKPEQQPPANTNSVYSSCSESISKFHGTGTEFHQKIWSFIGTTTNKVVAKMSIFFNRLLGLTVRANNFSLEQVRKGLIYISIKLSALFHKLIVYYSLFCSKVVYFSAISINSISSNLFILNSRFLTKQQINKKMLQAIFYYAPDLIHAHDLPQLKLAVAAKQKIKVPLIYDAHELYPEIESLTKKQKKELAKLEKKLTPNCDAVITVNPFIANEMKKRYRIPTPSVILNAVNVPTQFDSSVKYNRFREILNIPENCKILLFQGWMSKKRGLQSLVRAMCDVKDNVHLVLMGYGEALDELKLIIEENHLGHKVHVLNAVPQDELLFWTASADFGIIPYQYIDLNNYYCSPNKLFEFIQARLPIIANDLPFLRSIVSEKNLGEVYSLQETVDYTTAINRFVSRLSENDQEFKKNFDLAVTQYNWDVEGEKLLQIYGQVTK